MIVNLKVGDVVAARVVKALAAERLLLTFDGQPLRVQSGIEVPVGAELQLRVREIGRTVVLDLVRVEAPSARRPPTSGGGIVRPDLSSQRAWPRRRRRVRCMPRSPPQSRN